MRRKDSQPKRASRLWCLILVLLILVLPQGAMADDTEEVLTQRFTADGNFGLVAAGVGMTQAGPAPIDIAIPGTAVRVAYLYWAGYGPEAGGDDTVTLTRGSDGQSQTFTADPADGIFGPTFWFEPHYYFVYVADVTSLVQPGTDTYTVSDFGQNMTLRDGAGLMVVYQDGTLPLSRVVIRDGLDRFFRGWGEGPRGETAVNCGDIGTVGTERDLQYVMFVGEVIRLGEEEPRPNALWYLTGTGDWPTDLVNAPSDGPVIGQLIQGPPEEYPFASNDGPQWDTYAGEVSIPVNDQWICLQIESARDPRDATWRPASGIGIAVGVRTRLEETEVTDTPTPTDTDTPTPTDTDTPTPTDTDTPTTTDTPTPVNGNDHPVVPEASTLVLLGSSAVGLAGYVALQWRARRKP